MYFKFDLYIPREVDYADFPIIDISKAKTPAGRKELAPVVRDAMRTYGFLYVVNHGLTDTEVSTLETSGRCRIP